MIENLRLFARRHLSRETRRRLSRLAVWPPVGRVRFGHLRRVKPISVDFGNSRGLEIDRYYIESFLALHAEDVQGHVLEVKHDTYTRRFGANRVTKSDVLHKLPGNPDATIVADLTSADHIPSNTFDCIIFTQTLQFIYDTRSAIATLHRILKPGGVLLATSTGIAQISPEDFRLWGEYWRFTSLSTQMLFAETFPQANVAVRTYGNVLAAIAFLEGLAVEDLTGSELDAEDPSYELVVAVRARK
jgi:SAM-dependent methyltransferase